MQGSGFSGLRPEIHISLGVDQQLREVKVSPLNAVWDGSSVVVKHVDLCLSSDQ